MSVESASSPTKYAAWRDELRATLALAWPLILSNLTMALIQATDVVLMGWLGPHELAASALGVNFAMSMTIFCMGLVIAAAPLMAAELGRRFNAVREVRRSFRQSVWVAGAAVLPAWGILWNTDTILIALGQSDALAETAQTFMRGYMWSMLPFLVFQALRGFVSALERPGWIFTISSGGIVLNALASWALIFGHFGLPALGKLVLLGALGEGVLQGGLLALMLLARGLHGGLVFVFQHEPGNQYAEQGGGQGGEQDLDVGVGHGIKNGRLKRRMWNG